MLALKQQGQRIGAWFVLHPLARKGLDDLPKRVIEYHSDRDIYPLLSYVDMLITDSSIYFDFLHLDRPILFYPYNLERYLRDDRGMYVNYRDMTPELICRDFDCLLNELDQAMSSAADSYRQERRRIKVLAFANCDGTTIKRLWSAVSS